MTGHGRGEQSQDGFQITVEASSVNRKQAEISVSLPRELEVLETQIREAVLKRVARGKVSIRVVLHAAEDRDVEVRVNRRLAKAYAKELTALAKELKLKGDLTLDHLIRAPGVLETDSGLGDAEEFWPAVEAAVTPALERLVKMREREGAHLAKDLVQRIGIMRKAAARVKQQAPEVQRRYHDQLIERIKAAGLPAPAPEDERLLKEIVYFADRSDISEEITRLDSHFRQFDGLLKSTEPVGRTLDFLAQEMNREINTIGSKANDALIAGEVVTLKAELEKFREQAMNVE